MESKSPPKGVPPVIQLSRADPLDDDGLPHHQNHTTSMMREIPSEACFAPNGLPLGENDPAVEKGWENKRQFMLTVVGYSVGLGNIWRFPYLCQQNGGGAFLIPFLIMIILEGAPLLLIELGIGQRLRTGSLGAWNSIHPYIGGIGIASTIVAFLVGLYYNVIITWCFFFLFYSFRFTLPWSYCPVIAYNSTTEIIAPECEKSSETSYFWYRQALDISPSIEEFGGIKWWMLLCLLLAWVVIYFIIMRGIQSSGKVVYFTALFPYLVLSIFFFRGITLEGAGSGLLHLYKPKWAFLLKPSVWLDAATQVFYSFGLGFGSLIAFGAYNKPKNNVLSDVKFITLTNALTAIFASAVIFSVLGFKATAIHNKCILHNKQTLVSYYPERYAEFLTNPGGMSEISLENYFSNRTVETPFRNCSLEKELDEAAAGTGLAFVVFTQAIVELPVSPFWSIIFFMMLLALGIGSQIGTMEGVVSTVFEAEWSKNIRKEVLTAIVCGTCFLGGLIFVTGAGEYWVSLFDGYASTTGLVIIAFLETVAVMYIYGHKRFSEDIEFMTGTYPGLYWQINWRFIGPVAMAGLLVGSLISKIMDSPTYDAWDSEKGETVKAPYPLWTMMIALALITLSIAPIIIVWLMNLYKIKGPSGRGGSTATTMRRIDTAASTRPMMDDYEVSEYRSVDLPDDNLSDEAGGEPIKMADRSKKFQMEVIDC